MLQVLVRYPLVGTCSGKVCCSGGAISGSPGWADAATWPGGVRYWSPRVPLISAGCELKSQQGTATVNAIFNLTFRHALVFYFNVCVR